VVVVAAGQVQDGVEARRRVEGGHGRVLVTAGEEQSVKLLRGWLAWEDWAVYV